MRRPVALILAALVLVAILAAVAVHLVASSDDEQAPPDAGQRAPTPRHRPVPAPVAFQPLPPPVESARPAGPDAGQPLEEEAGPARKEPRDLPERFSEAHVRGAVTAALREADARGSSISTVDCSEYPCIVYVVNVNRYDSKKIQQAPSLAEYKAEAGFTGCFPTKRTDKNHVGVCGFAYEPKIGSDKDREAAMKRLRWRVEQMRDTEW